MDCPKCGIGELVLYKELDVARVYKITREGKVYKHPFSEREFNTEKDYLECNNKDGCGQFFRYEIGIEGRIDKNSIQVY